MLRFNDLGKIVGKTHRVYWCKQFIVSIILRNEQIPNEFYHKPALCELYIG